MDNIDNELDFDGDTLFAHPIDLVEYIAVSSDWPLKRLSDTQALLLINTNDTQFQILLNFDAADEVLRLTCAFQFPIDSGHKADFLELLNHINSKTWFGSFMYDFSQQAIIFLYALVLSEDAVVTPEQTYTLMSAAPEICKQFMPCFQAGRDSNDYDYAKRLASAWRKTGGNA